MPANSNQEVGGLALEKLFRTFSELTELYFYIRHRQNMNTKVKSNELYLFPFTSHFWHDRSIEVFTHFTTFPYERFIYTVPFHFDTFAIPEDIPSFLRTRCPYIYTNVRHLILSSTASLTEMAYSRFISKSFPKIKTVTLSNLQSSQVTIKTLTKYGWIQQPLVFLFHKLE